MLTATIGITAPDETVEFAQHLFDQCLDFLQAQIVQWNEQNENGVKFTLGLSLR